jgi:uncharacterized membrane protein YraQ (UPF0718 family)
MKAHATLRATTSVDLRLWSRVVAVALAWWFLYRINGPFWDLVVYDLAGLDPGERLGSSIHFFVYDTAKILLLLSGIIFVVTILRSFMSLERTRALLGGRHEGVANVAAAGLGVITPFCSCSAVPAFIGFVAAGVPIGVTLSFLIASPLVNEVALAMLFGLFGWRIALLYVAAGLTIAIVAGFMLGRVRGVERWVEPFVFETPIGVATADGMRLTWHDRVELGRTEVVTIVRKVLPFLLVGIAIGAVIHGWVPTDLFVRYAGAAHRSAPRQRARDGDAARVHDGRRRPVAPRGDPAPPGPEAPADRCVRRHRGRRDLDRRVPVQRRLVRRFRRPCRSACSVRDA